MMKIEYTYIKKNDIQKKYEIWILCIMYYTVFLSYFCNTCILYFHTLRPSEACTPPRSLLALYCHWRMRIWLCLWYGMAIYILLIIYNIFIYIDIRLILY